MHSHRISWWKGIRWPLASLAFFVFLATSFRAGWTQSKTDFPNYYTAAVLVTKRAPLHNFYNWAWFQKQMNYAGVENQLGGYIPQTPLTMFPMLAIANLEPQSAKRVWLLLNLAFLIISISLLSRVTHFSVPAIWLVAFAGFGTLHANFLLGQYYVFLLFLLILSFYCFSRKMVYGGGILLSVAAVLKLYGSPFVLYFAIKRRWGALAGMALGFVGAIIIAALIFGWSELTYFTTQVLPRALQGETLDPYNSGNGTISTLMRRLFVPEPELNPHPHWNAPLVFFFLQPFIAFLTVLFPVTLMRRATNEKQNFSLFCLALLFASPNTASYTFVLLLLPMLLLLDEANRTERALLISCYALLAIPLHPAWGWLFPKVWLLLILLIVVLNKYRPFLRAKETIAVLAVSATVAGGIAWVREAAYLQEPGQRWERLATRPGAIYSASPTVFGSGIVYESMGRTHYVLRWAHNDSNDEFTFNGEAFHPVSESPNGPIDFELVAHGTSQTMSLDVFARTLTRATPSQTQPEQAATSPDGQWVATTEVTTGSTQIYMRPVNAGLARRLTGGNCNSFSPAWQPDSKALIFASDCDRGIGLPALYRARVESLGSGSGNADK